MDDVQARKVRAGDDVIHEGQVKRVLEVRDDNGMPVFLVGTSWMRPRYLAYVFVADALPGAGVGVPVSAPEPEPVAAEASQPAAAAAEASAQPAVGAEAPEPKPEPEPRRSGARRRWGSDA